MRLLVDTSLLGRLANTDDLSHVSAIAAVAELRRRQETLLTAAQNLIEFRNFATRPRSANGLELTVSDARAKADEFESLFALVSDTPDIYPVWKSLANASAASGKQGHDVRLVAICRVHSIDGILTFNARHFLRLVSFVPGLSVVTPSNVINSHP
jgi:predicted nucleic acid-binding protein